MSNLGMPCKAAKGCYVVRLTEFLDMTSKFGLEYAKKAVDDTRQLKKLKLWISIPCTGGSSWKKINDLRPNAEERNAKHKAL